MPRAPFETERIPPISVRKGLRSKITEMIRSAGYIHGDGPATGKFLSDLATRNVVIIVDGDIIYQGEEN